MLEQRKTRRFELKLPLKVVRYGPQSWLGSGETRNLSSHGVLFTADAPIEVGEPIEYVISLPPGPEDDNAVDLHCVGKVLRSSPSPGKPDDHCFAVAATLERYEFVRPKSEDPVAG